LRSFAALLFWKAKKYMVDCLCIINLMKKYTLILAAALISSMAFAQILPDDVTGGQTMSGEVVPVLNSAPTISGEVVLPPTSDDININLPFDPSEVESSTQHNSANDYEYPPYSLNAATYVRTGPESIILFMIAIALGTGIYTYRMRAGRDQ
jgi:hypothetical protein